jgi:glycerophosphoryl diester phosphodiesterase
MHTCKPIAAAAAAMCITAVALCFGAERAYHLPASPDATRFAGLVIAHRGGSEAGPENTTIAVERAAGTGATAIEVDVFLSADGVPMVIHDPTVDRTTNGTGLVSSFTAAQLHDLDAATYRKGFGHVPVPTLAEVLDAADRHSLRIEIELKAESEDHEALASAIVSMFQARDLYDRAWVGSFDPRLLYRVRSRDPRIVCGFAVRPEATGNILVDWILESHWLPRFLGAGIIEPHRAMVNADTVRDWRSRGYVINAWTANHGSEQQRLRDLGVSYTTNCPLSHCGDDPSDLVH